MDGWMDGKSSAPNKEKALLLPQPTTYPLAGTHLRRDRPRDLRGELVKLIGTQIPGVARWRLDGDNGV